MQVVLLHYCRFFYNSCFEQKFQWNRGFYKRRYVHEVLVNSLVKLAQEKSVVIWTERPNMNIVVDLDDK